MHFFFKSKKRDVIKWGDPLIAVLFYILNIYFLVPFKKYTFSSFQFPLYMIYSGDILNFFFECHLQCHCRSWFCNFFSLEEDKVKWRINKRRQKYCHMSSSRNRWRGRLSLTRRAHSIGKYGIFLIIYIYIYMYVTGETDLFGKTVSPIRQIRYLC